MRDLVRDLALALRESVLPHLGSHAGRAHEDAPAAGGDVTFAIDADAERTLERFLAERAPELAYYSEDRGLVEPAVGDVSVGCVVEIPSGAVFLAERGRGLVESPPVRLSRCDTLERMFWTYGFRGRPARPTAEVLAELIDASSVGGATFELGSAAFDMTRVVTGQLDAYVEPGPRLVADVPGMRSSRRPTAAHSGSARCSDRGLSTRYRWWLPPTKLCTI